MTAIRRAAAIATDLTCRAAGRRTVVRTARYVLWRARLDYRNDLSTNGESALQRWILPLSQAGEQIHVADVGANVGRWSESMLAAASKAGRETDLRLHVFEPDSQAFARLTVVLDGRLAKPEQGGTQRPAWDLAVLRSCGRGRNELLVPRTGGKPCGTGNVVTTTLDSYAERSCVARFALVKINAEGHDLAVMRGAHTLLAEHRIAVVQFEYNHRWIFGRFYLRDALNSCWRSATGSARLPREAWSSIPGRDRTRNVRGRQLPGLRSGKVAVELPAVTWWKSE